MQLIIKKQTAFITKRRFFKKYIMNHIYSLLLLVCVTASSYAQKNEPTREYYQQKSINRKALGWIKVGIGTGLIAIGLASWGKSDAVIDFGPGLSIITGLGIGISSLNSFSNAKKYSRMSVGISLKNYKMQLLNTAQNSYVKQPLLTLKIGL